MNQFNERLTGKAFKAHIEALKRADEDFDFYPTKDSQIALVKADIDACFDGQPSVLDIGAGDGRVLMALTDGHAKRFAIEKATANLNRLDRSILISGTDFYQSNLITRKVDIIFCNPPYSDYANWMETIIKTAHARFIYMIVPVRWRKNKSICEALKRRTVLRSKDIETSKLFEHFEVQLQGHLGDWRPNPSRSDEVNESNRRYHEGKVLANARFLSLGTDTFLDADRQARGEVELIRINLGYRWDRKFRVDGSGLSDPFNMWFNDTFGGCRAFNPLTEVSTDVKPISALENEMISARGGVPKVLADQYQAETEHFIDNIRQVATLDYSLLKAVGVDLEKVKESLRSKMTEINPRYWKILFDFYAPISQRLCKSQRETMLKIMIESNATAEVTVSNIMATTEYVIKNAAAYVDEQLLECFSCFIERDNIRAFKSNQRLFGGNSTGGFRSMSRYELKKRVEQFYFDYRMIVSSVGGLGQDYGQYYGTGLRERAVEFINDLLIVAYNLGFDTKNTLRAHQGEEWNSKKRIFEYQKDGQSLPLFEVRAFKKGTLHFRMCQELTLAMNVEHSRLRGWVKSASEAVEELNITDPVEMEQVATSFGSNVDLLALRNQVATEALLLPPEETQPMTLAVPKALAVGETLELGF